jgi:hypothetical protein
MRAQSANAHRNANGLAGHGFKCRAKFGDSRHNPKMQCGPRHPQQQTGHQQTPSHAPNANGQPVEAALFQQGQEGGSRHKKFESESQQEL